MIKIYDRIVSRMNRELESFNNANNFNKVIGDAVSYILLLNKRESQYLHTSKLVKAEIITLGGFVSHGVMSLSILFGAVVLIGWFLLLAYTIVKFWIVNGFVGFEGHGNFLFRHLTASSISALIGYFAIKGFYKSRPKLGVFIDILNRFKSSFKIPNVNRKPIEKIIEEFYFDPTMIAEERIEVESCQQNLGLCEQNKTNIELTVKERAFYENHLDKIIHQYGKFISDISIFKKCYYLCHTVPEIKNYEEMKIRIGVILYQTGIIRHPLKKPVKPLLRVFWDFLICSESVESGHPFFSDIMDTNSNRIFNNNKESLKTLLPYFEKMKFKEAEKFINIHINRKEGKPYISYFNKNL